MMKRLIMCQGLPGAGKTTWAQKQVEELYFAGPTVRISKDDIRRELETQGWVWSRENEQDVVTARDAQIAAVFQAGAAVVISDDTNFGRKHTVRLEQLARENGAVFEIKRFPIPLDECIRRDSLRMGKARVGEQVIRGMAAKYLQISSSPSVVPVVPNQYLKDAIICDLDGTLSLFKEKGHRGPYDASCCAEDDVNEPVRLLLEVFYRFMDYQIIYVSGRFDCYRSQTDAFFRRHHVPPGLLYMRTDGDRRKDTLVKGELFDTYVRGKYNVRFVLDDRDSVVAFWRSIGLTCFQVAPGTF